MLKLASLAAAVTLSALSLLPADAQAAFRRHGGGHVAAARSHVAPIRHHFVRVAHGPRVYRSYRRGYVVAPRHYLPVVTYARRCPIGWHWSRWRLRCVPNLRYIYAPYPYYWGTGSYGGGYRYHHRHRYVSYPARYPRQTWTGGTHYTAPVMSGGGRGGFAPSISGGGGGRGLAIGGGVGGGRGHGRH